jgi:hypothetical protein
MQIKGTMDKSPTGRLEPPYEVIWDLLTQGEIIPFLGAGASLSPVAEPPAAAEPPHRLPRGSELARHLAKKANFPQGEPDDNLPKVAEYYSIAVGRSRLHEQLHDIFDRDYPFLGLHKLLARVPGNLLIVTTNYDDLIERAFQEQGKPFDLVVHTTGDDVHPTSIAYRKAGSDRPEHILPKNLIIDLRKTTVIYKMHGAVDRRPAKDDSYVITEDDFVDFIVRMEKKSAIPPMFIEHIARRNLLFLGYGLADWNLRVIFSKMQRSWSRTKRPEPRSWAIQKGPSLLEQELWHYRGVKIYDMTLEEFVDKLAQAGTP